MKKYLMTLMLMPLMLLAESETVNGITWTYTVRDGTAEVGTGSYWDWTSAISSTTSGSISIPVTLGQCPVTSVGDCAFCDCRNITTVEIPSSVTSIGKCAFYGCRGIKSITIPSSVRTVAEGAFGGCYSLESVIFEGDCPVGSDLFENVWPSVYYYEGTAGWSSSFCGCFVYQYDPGFEYEIADDHVIVKGFTKFAEKIVIPEIIAGRTVTEIADYGLSGSSAIKAITIPKSVVSIGNWVLSSCDNLSEVRFEGDCPFGVSHGILENYSGSSINRKILLRHEAQGWSGSGYNNYAYEYDPLEVAWTKDYDGAVSVTGVSSQWKGGKLVLPDAIAGSKSFAIGSSAFKGNTKLTGVFVSGGTHSIGYNAFYDCSKLTEVEIAEGLSWIGSSAFYGTALKTVTFPSTVESIGSSAFASLTSLIDIYFMGNAPEVGSNAFKPYSSYYPHTVHVAPGTTGWNVEIPGTWKDMQIEYMPCVNHIEGEMVILRDATAEELGEMGCKCRYCDEILWRETFGQYADGGPYTNNVGGVKWLFYIKDGIVSLGGGSSSEEAVSQRTAETLVVPSTLGGHPVVKVDDYAFANCQASEISLPDSIVTIGSHAFNSSRLKVINSPPRLREIGDSAFEGFSRSQLSAFILPKSLKKIGNRAFYGVNWSSISIEAEDLEIGEYAFYFTETPSSTSYADIHLLGSGIVVGACAFAGYEHGAGVQLDLSGVASLGYSAFSRAGRGRIYNKSSSGYWYDMGCATITITKELKTASYNAFYNASIGKVMVDDITTIFAMNEWWGCALNRALGLETEGFFYRIYIGDTVLEDLVIPSGVTSVPPNALAGARLRSIVIPETVTNIGSNAFSMCRATLQFDGRPPQCGDNALIGCAACTYAAFDSDWQSVASDGKWRGLPLSRGKALDYGEAVGSSLDTFTTQGTCWFVESEDTYDGDRALRSGAISGSGESSLQCQIVGPAKVSFCWKTTLGAAGYSKPSNALTLTVDSAEQASISKESDWSQVTTEVDEGKHKLEWRYQRGNSDRYYNGDCAYLDQVQVKYLVRFDVGDLGERVGGGECEQWVEVGCPAELPELQGTGEYVFDGWDRDVDSVNESCTVHALWKKMSIQEALNAEAFSFVNDAEFPWTITTSEFHDGVASVRSGKILKNKSTAIETTVKGAGTISFWWKASSEIDEDDGSPCDRGTFYIDGVEKCVIAGETQWQYVELTLGEGSHLMSWEYSKDKSADFGEDCVWLDEVTWTTKAVVPTVAELPSVFGEESVVTKEVKTEAELALFNAFLKNCAITAASDLSAAQKQFAYQSFKLAEITTAPQLFEEEPVLKIDDIEMSGDNLSLTISLTAGDKAIELAKDKLAEKIRVGTSLDSIVDPPEIVASPSADGTSLTFTITQPKGGQGFVRVKID